ncbi:MAG: hypothetical protein WAS05_07305 [Candidatus Nanopelagicales bacterium]
MSSRPTISVDSPPGGWLDPWPNVAEIEAAFAHQNWTLVGGLMTQLHAIHNGVASLRPTNDVDVVLHIETRRGRPTQAAKVLKRLGYELTPSLDDKNETAHRYRRAKSKAGVHSIVATPFDIVDVLIADHSAPRQVEKLEGRKMVAIEGGTQALNRTINAELEINPGRITTLSVPSAFGAALLKAVAYRADSRDPGRHLTDAAVLLACIEDPRADRKSFTGSDRSRVLILARQLPASSPYWKPLSETHRQQGQAALAILSQGLN